MEVVKGLFQTLYLLRLFDHLVTMTLCTLVMGVSHVTVTPTLTHATLEETTLSDSQSVRWTQLDPCNEVAWCIHQVE